MRQVDLRELCGVDTCTTDAEREKLDELFARHPRVGTGWRALQELYGLYLAEDRAAALAALDRSCDLYPTGQLPRVP